MLEDDLIELTPAPPEVPPGESPISFETEAAPDVPRALSAERLDQRAAKYDFALGEKSPGVEAIRSRLDLGFEKQDRERLALEKQVEQHDIKLNIIKELGAAAAKEGRPLSHQESQTILSLSSADLAAMQADPDTFFEKEFARKVTSTMAALGDDSPVQGAIVEIGTDKVDASLGLLENAIAAREAYEKLADEAAADLAEQSWAGWSADFAKGFVPGYVWLKMRNRLTKEKGGSFLPGDNLADQIEAAYSGDIREMLPLVKQTYQELAQDNQQLATFFAQALISYGNDARLIDNIIIPLGDISTVVSPIAVAKGAGAAARSAAKGGLEKTRQFATMSKDVLAAITRPGAKTTDVLDAVGAVPAVARTRAIERLKAAIANGGASPATLDELGAVIPGFMNAAEIVGGPRSSFSAGFLKNLEQELTQARDEMVSAVALDPVKADRFGPVAVEVAVDLAIRRFREERKDVEHAILNVFERPIEKGLGEHAVTIKIGNKGAEPFKTAGAARAQAKLLGFRDFQVNPSGTGWSIDVQRPMDFSDASVRSAMVIDAAAAPTKTSNLLGTLLTSLRTPEETISPVILSRLKKGLAGATKLEKVLHDHAKRIGRVKNKKDFATFINAQRLIANPNNPEKLGRYLHTVGDFEAAWFTKFNRVPEEEEVRAYFSYKQLNDIDYFARNLGLYLDKSAAGLAMHRIPGLEKPLEGKIVKLSAFENGTQNEAARIVVLQEGAEPVAVNTKFNRRLDINDPESEKAMDLVRRLANDDGYTLVQLSPVGRNQFKQADSESAALSQPTDFVLVKTAKAEPLPLLNIPYQEGGHHMLDPGVFIAQPRLYRTKDAVKYYGDTSVLYAATEALAKDVSKHFEEARRLYNLAAAIPKGPVRKSANATFANYVKNNLPVTPSQLSKDFETGRLDPSLPFMVRHSEQSLDDAHKLDTLNPGVEYIRERDSAYNLYRGRVNLQFTQEREGPIFQVFEEGVGRTALYGMKPAPLVDAFEAMDQAMGAMINGRNIEPLKLEVAERILAEFGDLFETSSDDIAKNPFAILKQGAFKSNLAGDDIERLTLARQARARAMQFFRVETQEQKLINYVATKLLKGNPEAQASLRKTMSDILLEKDPASVVRGLSYQFHMGLFNVTQLIKQGQGWAQVVGLAGPTVGVQAGLSAMIQHMVMESPDKLTMWGAKTIAKLGWDPKEFIDATEAMRRTGFGILGREQATREQNMRPTVISTGLSKALDAGMTPTRMGEEFHRRAAWNAAYKEFLIANKGRRPTDTELQNKVLARADLLTNNMTHASAASWNQGLTGIPTQFWSYQARLMELYTGKRLTWQEKTRLFATYSALYGIPVGASSVAGYPIYKEIKEWLINNNLDTDDSTVTKVLNDGALSLFTEMLTGQDTNVEEVFGPAGIPFFKDVFVDQDKGVLEALAGPGGSIVGSLLFETYSGLKWVYKSIMPGEEALPVTAQDFSEVFGNVSTLSIAQRMSIGLAAHGYLSNRGELIEEEPSSARLIFNNMLGITPQDVSDVYTYFQLDKENRIWQGQLAQEIKKDTRAMLRAETDEEKERWSRRIQIRAKLLNDPSSQISIMADVIKENRDVITKARLRRMRQGPDAQEFESRKIIEGQED